jgi:hypothetical protein
MHKAANTLALIRTLHTAIYIVMAAAVFALFYASLTGARPLWFWPALLLVSGEIAVFVGFGMKCPLTALAVQNGASPGDDTFLPEPITRHTLTFFGPLIALTALLLLVRYLELLLLY